MLKAKEFSLIDFENKTTNILKQELSRKMRECRHNNDVLIKYGCVNNKDVAILFGLWFMREFFYIDLVFVDYEFRKKGLANMLIRELIKELRQKNCKVIYTMLVSYDNKYMLENILLKEGFVKISEYENQRLYILDLKE